MLNTYTVNLPTPERGQALGINMNGFGSRTLHFFVGMEFALKAVDSAVVFKVASAAPIRNNPSAMDYRNIVVETDSIPLINSVRERLGPYDVTLTLKEGRE